jgi:hypothetical protein
MVQFALDKAHVTSFDGKRLKDEKACGVGRRAAAIGMGEYTIADVSVKGRRMSRLL